MALPIVAIVGRVNVGKSTLFNRFVGKKLAVVEDFPGVTRDRLYAQGEVNTRKIIAVDTGGLVGGEGDVFAEKVKEQAIEALGEADLLVVLMDGREGVTAGDHEIADIVRRSGKPYVLAINKMEKPSAESSEFYELRLGEPIDISAEQGHGIVYLEDAIIDLLPRPEEEPPRGDEMAIAVVGRPNAGKSALINAILGQERLIVSDVPGTTRDAVDTWAEFDGKPVRLVDTAGLRRKGKRSQGTEFYSALRTLRAVQEADIGVIVVDALEGITAQDARVALEVHEMGRAAIVVANKWDTIVESALGSADELDAKGRAHQMKTVWSDFQHLAEHELPFLNYAPIVPTCALTGEGVADLLPLCKRVHEQFTRRIDTGPLNRCIRRAVARHNPPSKGGRPLRILYATQVQTRPPTIALFVSDPKLMHFSYERYLMNALRSEFGFEGTPVKLLIRARRKEDRFPED
ncbi:MAG: ribosome biogenesis GTPase Der [Armatimonadetes bacterium]|jgi:GTP-binding protein|nr:ribosome biogenesis GTPase Der [Armatimonadota bacterium]MDI9584512.1 ribosome biogenesis GTPase Der [Acidobacteriota bacterium]